MALKYKAARVSGKRSRACEEDGILTDRLPAKIIFDQFFHGDRWIGRSLLRAFDSALGFLPLLHRKALACWCFKKKLWNPLKKIMFQTEEDREELWLHKFSMFLYSLEKTGQFHLFRTFSRRHSLVSWQQQIHSLEN